MTTVVVLQSNYIPWKGYFDLIHDADIFVFYDDLQFTKNDWRNRNKIKTAQGLKWLSIPVGTNANRLICDVVMEDTRWQRSHWDSLRQQYEKSPFFKLYRPFFEEIYLGRQWENMSELNQYLIQSISHEILKISTQFINSRDFKLSGQKLDRLLDLVKQSKATRYISGPSARNYIVEERFDELGIELQWKDYSNYPEYPQPYPPFEHGVTILDLLFNVGSEAPFYIWGWREKGGTLKRTLSQLVRYGVIGLASNAIGYVLYLLLTSLGMEPKMAMSLLYGIGVLQTFLFNKRWTFGHQGAHRLVFFATVLLTDLGISST